MSAVESNVQSVQYVDFWNDCDADDAKSTQMTLSGHSADARRPRRRVRATMWLRHSVNLDRRTGPRYFALGFHASQRPV